ncbi:Riboflavin synthase-like beta-barrel [Sesbania bispinosa]|nr:Riboflavin synthase-like beta-barrel [Sesbania bispinosa]
MASTTLLAILKLLLIFICAAWVSLWLLKPTQVWTKNWKHAEESASNTIFGYYGLNFAVYTFPIIAVAIIGLLFLDLKERYQRSRSARSSSIIFSNPLVVNSLLGILSSVEILVSFLFIIFLAWTYYSRISNDFKKLMPDKSLKLNIWELKYLRIATRFGLLAEACLALLLLPILRGLAIFRILGIQFEASVRHFYTVFPGIFLFSLDKLLRVIQSSPKTCMVSARILPCNAVELILPKDPRLKYNPTSVIFLKIPTISHLQWHSFSIISSSKADEHIMSVIIKCQGWWTNTVYDLVHAELNKGADKRKGLYVAIEGPYGPASLDFLSTLIAVILRWRRLKKGIQPISQKEIEPLDLSSAETRNALEEHEVHYGGRPNFKDIFGKFRNETCGSDIGVLVCGPESMKESVASACQQESECFKLGVKRTEPHFTFHSLNFTL